MKIFAVVIDDRHIGYEIELFSTESKAIKFAQSVLDEPECIESASYVDHKDAVLSDEDMRKLNLVFYRCYSTEGDSVYIYEKELN